MALTATVQAKKSVEDKAIETDAAAARVSELGIDPDRLAAGGGSAGGFLAAATATLPC